MKKIFFTLLLGVLLLSCNEPNPQNVEESNNYIEWFNGEECHDSMIRSGMNHYHNIEWERAYVYFEKAIALDSTSFAAHVMLASMSRANSEKQELHYSMAKKYVADKNENSKRFVSFLDFKSDSGNRSINGATAERNKLWNEMHETEPRGPFIQFGMATTAPDLKDRINALEELQEEWQKRGISHAPVVNYLGYLYYQAGEKEKSKASFESYLALYPEGYNPYDSMAEYYMYEKNYEQAKKYYEKVLDVFPLSNSANIALKVIEEKLK